MIFTPHLKEWERLSGIPIEEQTYERREAVDRLGATVVLKKHGTEIFFKDEDFKLTIGSPAMAYWWYGRYTCWYDYKLCRSI